MQKGYDGGTKVLLLSIVTFLSPNLFSSIELKASRAFGSMYLIHALSGEYILVGNG